jgi:hypothetical protein
MKKDLRYIKRSKRKFFNYLHIKKKEIIYNYF